MSVKTSVGLRNAMMVDGSFKSQMDNCTLKIYGGTEPTNSSDAIGSATLLCELFNGNDGITTLTFEGTATDGIIQKTASEVWEGTCVATGTATFYRLELAADDQAQSTTHKRLQGSVGVVGADLLIGDVGLVQNTPQRLSFYSVVLPM